MSRWTRSAAESGSMARTWLARSWRASRDELAGAWRAGVQTARLAIGIPDYDNYADHMRRHHPALVPMTRDEFFHERMLARYGKGRSRCC